MRRRHDGPPEADAGAPARSTSAKSAPAGLDPDAARLLREVGPEFALPPGLASDPAVATAYLARRRAPVARRVPPETVGEVADRVVPGGPPVRTYLPAGGDGGRLLVFLHGGGWVAGDIDSSDAICRRLANLTRSTVVNVEYRLAPEHPFPAAFDDCVAATAWAAAHAVELGADPARLVVAGSSAGGNLAAAVALASREPGAAAVALQLLICPALDPRMGADSYAHHGEGYLLERDQMEWFWAQYLRESPDRTNGYAAPALMEDLAGAPPAVVVTAEFDPLRDEGEAYARRLAAAGVAVEVLRLEGQVHGFVTMLQGTPGHTRALARIAAALDRLSAPRAESPARR
ncbi:MAG TPA: alpha/beta hydrolase [Acidimicrobiales bacterium]|nr:alpha/beta hydrolase [Acidimicrobiales bacterium]